MNRYALSLFVLLGWAAPAKAAVEGDDRSLGVMVSPVGAFALTDPGTGWISYGYSVGVDFTFHRPLSVLTLGGHVSASGVATEATPLFVRLTPFPESRVQPFLGAGVSMLFPHSRSPAGVPPLKVGAEVEVGLEVSLGTSVFLTLQARYQNFAYGPEWFGKSRQETASAYCGVGFRI